MESKLTEKVFCGQRAVVVNGNTPIRSSLSESDMAEMDEFMEFMQILLSSIGLVFLESIVQSSEMQEIWYCWGKGVKAMAVRTNEGFVILEGSTVVSSGTETALRSINETKRGRGL